MNSIIIEKLIDFNMKYTYKLDISYCLICKLSSKNQLYIKMGT